MFVLCVNNFAIFRHKIDEMTYEQMLETKEMRLRALEPNDIDLLYHWENDTSLWGVSSTLTPFSRHMLREYIDASQTDIYAAKQLRLMIEDKIQQKTVGSIDLYDFDAHNRRAGIGIFVAEDFQQKHLATKALGILLTYCKSMLLLHQVYVEVPVGNAASMTLFQHASFTIVGTKKDWILRESAYEDVVVMQKIL